MPQGDSRFAYPKMAILYLAKHFKDMTNTIQAKWQLAMEVIKHALGSIHLTAMHCCHAQSFNCVCPNIFIIFCVVLNL
jgi:hypothetical protein